MTTSIRGFLVTSPPKSICAIANELKLHCEECKFEEGAELTMKCFSLSTQSSACSHGDKAYRVRGGRGGRLSRQ